MPVTCKDCSMEFETPAQLENHQKKFCMGANGNEDDIDKRLNELKKLEHDLDYGLGDEPGFLKKSAAPVS